MFKKLLLTGIVSGILAGIAAVIYQQVYSASLGADFSAIARPLNIFVTCIAGGLIAATGYWLMNKWLKAKGDLVFNFVYVVLSFASILGAFAFKLPFDIDVPELFPGLVVPMHFFPALAWFTIKPLFFHSPEIYPKAYA